MKYNILLFDLDGTLLDFDLAETIALEKISKKYLGQINSEIRQQYNKINKNLWKQFDRGEIQREELFNIRFGHLLQELGKTCTKELAIQINQEYLDNLKGIWISGAEEICKILAKKHDIYIVTNGESKTQRRKIEEMGLQQYIKGTFISEEIGSSKPKKEYFDTVFSKIGVTDSTKILMIGDRLTSDIKGGNHAGIDTCWYNPQQKTVTEEVDITYEIQALSELLEIVK